MPAPIETNSEDDEPIGSSSAKNANIPLSSADNKKLSRPHGAIRSEEKYQSLMRQYMNGLPKRANLEAKYEEERKDRNRHNAELKGKNKQDKQVMDINKFKANPRGRDKQNKGGNFTAVSQEVWDVLRYPVINDVRPKEGAYQRAALRSNPDPNKAYIKQVRMVEDSPTDDADENSKAKKLRLKPVIYKPYPDSTKIPWPDPDFSKRNTVKGPAYERSENHKKKLVRTMDPFTGTWIIQQPKQNKHVSLSFEPDINSYVDGDLLAGLRIAKRNKRIGQAEEFLADTKLTDEQREAKRLMVEEEGARAEAARARAAILEKKLAAKMLNGRISSAIESRGRRSRTASSSSVTTADAFRPSTVGPPRSAVSRESSKNRRSRSARSARSFSRSSTATSSSRGADGDDFWKGVRAKTPIWGNWGSRHGSAGRTPFARPRSTSERFSGWMGNLKRLMTPGSSEARVYNGGGSDDDLMYDNFAPNPNAEPFDDRHHSRPIRSKGDKQRDGSVGGSIDHNSDGTPYFGNGGSSVGSLGSIGTAGSFEFLNDADSLYGLAESSLVVTRKKKKKKKKKMSATQRAQIDSGTVVSFDTLTYVDDASSIGSLAGGSISINESASASGLVSANASASAKSGRSSRRKRKKSRGAKHEDDESDAFGDDGDSSTIGTMMSAPFDFIDEDGLASQMCAASSTNSASRSLSRKSSLLTPEISAPPEPLVPVTSQSIESIQAELDALNNQINTAEPPLIPSAVTILKGKVGNKEKVKDAVNKQADRLENYLVSKRVWPKKWKRMQGKDRFTSVSRAADFITKRAVPQLYFASQRVLNTASQVSLAAIELIAGPEAAGSISLGDVLTRRTITPDEMMSAAANGQRFIVGRALMQGKEKIPVDFRDFEGRTAVHVAVENGCISFNDTQLRDWYRDEEAQKTRLYNTERKTPESVETIRKSRHAQYFKLLEMLLARGADINAQQTGHADENVSALHTAAKAGSIPIIRWLLSHGADINSQTGSKTTPLHFACRMGHCDTALYLLEEGANIMARNGAGQPPFHFAAQTGGTKMVKLLLKAGTEKNAVDLSGKTAAMVAQHHGRRATFEVIRSWAEGRASAQENLAFLESLETTMYDN